MKRKVHLISLLFLASSAFASTNVPNSLSGDTQWNADGSPYVIQGKAVVPKGATLRVGPNVKVVFQGNAALEVDGTLDVAGSAAAPAVFDMTQGGLQSELFLNGAEAEISNAKFLSGVFLVQDSNLHLQWFDITKGSGLYLRGAGTASVKDGKIYGNATGVVLDGKVKATLRFNTITQNSYGLYLKGYSDLEFKNNSVHDNGKDVVNNTPALKLSGNYWGTTNASVVASRVQGSVDVGSMMTLKDLLRVYIQTQLPEITQEMSVALAKKEKREALEMAKKEKALKKEMAAAKTPAGSTGSPQAAQAAPSTVEEIPPAPPAESNTAETTAQAPAETSSPEASSAPAPVEETGSVKTVQVTTLPPAPHKLKPLANLPPDQGNIAESPAAAPPVNEENSTASTAPPSPESGTTSPAPPSSTDLALPPAGTASETTPPVPPEVSGSNATTTAAPSAPPVPPSSDVIAPPDIETSTAPLSPPSTGGNNTTTTESVPAPPELNEQVPPSPPQTGEASTTVSTPASQPVSTTSAPPPPPVAPANTDQSAAPPSVDSPALQLNNAPTANQQNAVTALNGVNGDIDGMQAPPLDLDTSNSSNGGTNTTQPNGATTQKSNDSGVALPPIPDSTVTPPKDLDLPPTDDLGNINLDSQNK